MPAASGDAARVRLLMVEDLRTDAELEIRELRRAGLSVEHRLVDREETFVAALEEFVPDLIVSDFSMPHFDGMAALALARERAPDVPFIFVSGTIGEEYAIRALKNGATDYVLKSNLVRLPAAVERALHDAREHRAKRGAEQALRESEERFRGILESAAEGIAVIDASGRVVTLNASFAAMFGFGVDEMPGRSIAELAPPELRAEQSADVAELTGVANGRGVIRRSAAGIRKDGARIALDLSLSSYRVKHGLQMICVARDVTEQVRQRERLERLLRIRDLLGTVNAAIVRIRERQELLRAFCRIAVERGGFLAARVVEFERASGQLRIAVATDDDHDSLIAVIDAYNRDPAGSPSLLGLALRGGKPVVSNDAAADARALQRGIFAGQGVKSIACLPLSVEGKVVGAVVLRAGEPGFFDEEETSLLGELTDNLSFALELQAKQEQLRYLALYDPLTDLPNRALFQDRLTQAIEAARRGSTMLSLIVFDVERFKAINDAYGQSTGDRVLREIAARLREAVGDINLVARLGGNLFAVMRPDIQDASDAARLLQERTFEVIGSPIVIDGGREIKVTAKSGIALFPEDGVDADALFRNAEASLKRAKETGERFLFYAPHINARVAEQVDLENRLRRAVEQRELFLHFQPKVELESRRIVGLEALMRWRGPDNLLMSPARFVPVLEETGLILDAGRHVLELAALTYREWKTAGLNPPRIAVNVSALQLRQKSFVEDVQAALGGPDNGVDLEITESLLMHDIDESIRKLRTLRETGASISLDDFGTGHSSLAYLSRLPIDTVKIDRSFVHAMTASADATSIISTIISLAQALRLKVVAEGVEDEEQARLLRLLRCDQMQGYLFSAPQAKDKVEAMLRGAST